MADREQQVQIGFGYKTITRVVYDIRNFERYKFQTGFIKHDDNHIPVWRPYDPEDRSLDAHWRSGKWYNLYTLKMNEKKDVRYVQYDTGDITIENETLSLPKVSIELMYHFKDYLKSVT